MRRFASQRWLALWAAMLGYMLDALDVLLYVFAVQTLRDQFHWSASTAGLVSSATLITSAAGGIVAGIVADRIGRTRTLVYTILLYSIGSAGSATSVGLFSLIAWRAVVGLGLGGAWSAGAVLVSESWPPQHRAKAIGLMQSGWAIGYMLAAATTALILPRFGWRVLFLVGILPHHLDSAQGKGARDLDEPDQTQSHHGALPSAPCTPHIFRHRPGNVRFVCILGTRHVASRISLRS